MAQRIDLSVDNGHLELPDTSDGYVSAVIRRTPDGTVAWRALPPNGNDDAWVAVSLPSDDTVTANSWSGWRVKLDVRTGTEIIRQFTK
jgi:hypothetical protein